MDEQVQREATAIFNHGLFSCSVCERQFERADHLRRHLDSHNNRRKYKCLECGKAYNRRDLLHRHSATHELDSISQVCRAARVDKACKSCASSKLKCDNETPCSRCRTAGRECIRSRPRSVQSTSQSSTSRSESRTARFENDSELNHRHATQVEILEPLNPQATTAHHPSVAPAEQQNMALSTMELLPLAETDNLNNNATFFEQILAADAALADDSAIFQALPNLDTFMEDTDQWLDGIGIVNFDFGTALGFYPETRPQTRVGSPELAFGPELARARFEAFKRSPWLWMPSAEQSTFADQNDIAMDSDAIDLAASPQQALLPDLAIDDVLSLQSRDRILAVVMDTAKSRVSISTFPGPEFLDTLIKTCIIKRAKQDCWLHPGTFHSDQTRPELLTALVAGGCICFGIQTVSRTGLLLQEVVRLSLERLFEADNSVIRDLQYLQAYMLWIDIGVTCGLKRKMEIAESRFQPLCTALRRLGAFDHTMYQTISPLPEDDQDTLRRKWKEWATQESFTRLAYHVLQYDMQVALVFNRQPLTSYAEFTAPLPCSEELWFAATAEEWRARYLAMKPAESTQNLCLRQILTKPQSLKLVPSGVDIDKIKSLLLCGLAGQVWELKQQSLVIDRTDANRASAQLWQQMRQSELQQAVQIVYLDDPNTPTPALRAVFQSFILMHIHVSVEEVQRFAGKHGESEARRAYSSLEIWATTEGSRSAVWHAGQVLRAGRRVPSFMFRGFDSLVVYHATLVLWAYGVLLEAAKRKNKTTRNLNLESNDTQVYLDGPRTDTVQRFLDLGIGRPGIEHNMSQIVLQQQGTKFCDLRRSNQIMIIGSKLLESNYPTVGPGDIILPPLVENLRDLMREFGRLAGVP